MFATYVFVVNNCVKKIICIYVHVAFRICRQLLSPQAPLIMANDNFKKKETVLLYTLINI